MKATDRRICEALFLLHELKVGPSNLLVLNKNAMLKNIGALETRALTYLAGYAPWETPKDLQHALNEAIAVVCSHIPVTRDEPGKPGNPGKTFTSVQDEQIIAIHQATGKKLGTLTREAGLDNEDRRRIAREVDRRKARSVNPK